jgi:hypothetical protein
LGKLFMPDMLFELFYSECQGARIAQLAKWLQSGELGVES